ncbi:hypothetical protein D0Z70_21890 [Sphingobium terrigena]|uniref:Uncharacterized protein n=2 Tax=Sphingobium TaxID=165695 RepID=A0A418YLQ9_9SPHN|nr:hypothetical protein [Sphingobium sp.]RJG52037.1 hypothetical protein D0Z70_21890 [Sphingobium terrigena]RSU55407.1 hypothetical protein DAH51_16940 [Sphingobium yanoikuyae]
MAEKGGINRSPRCRKPRFCPARADSDEAAPRFRDDCAPSFRDDVAPPETGPCWLRLLLFRSCRPSSL